MSTQQTGSSNRIYSSADLNEVMLNGPTSEQLSASLIEALTSGPPLDSNEDAIECDQTTVDTLERVELSKRSNLEDALGSILQEPTTPPRTSATIDRGSAPPSPETPTAYTIRPLPRLPTFAEPNYLTPGPDPSGDRFLSMFGSSVLPQPRDQEQQVRWDQPDPRPYQSHFEAQMAEHWAERERRISEQNMREYPMGSNPGPSYTRFTSRQRRQRQPNFESPFRNRASARLSSQPWHPSDPMYDRERDEFNRRDVHGRNAALTTISNILFNFDITPDEAADLLEDACATAWEVGVAKHELLSRTVTFGNSDLGMTPLCLEASRWEVGADTQLLEWLIENSPPDSVEREIRHGCLKRNNGMGDQRAWSAMKLFVPEQMGRAVFAYDTMVENIVIIPGAAKATADKAKQSDTTLVDDSDDEGSLYDDVSLVDGASSINQADIETLKSSDDEGNNDSANAGAPVLGPNIRAHRARIDIPLFKEALTFEDSEIAPAYIALPPWAPSVPSKILREYAGDTARCRALAGPQHMPMKNRVLTVEWMYEGRIWALGLGQDKLVLTLRFASDQVSAEPVKVKASIRIFPGDNHWDGLKELTAFGPDMLLPTQESADLLLLSPTYSCELGEAELAPGPPTLNGNTSVSKEIPLSLLDTGMSSAQGSIKVEVVIKATEPKQEVVGSDIPDMDECADEKPVPSGSLAEDTNEWQFVERHYITGYFLLTSEYIVGDYKASHALTEPIVSLPAPLNSDPTPPPTMPDIQSLEPEIYSILTAPGIDLNTVSAKRVRAQLKQNNPELTDDWVRENKEAIDNLTALVFDRVRDLDAPKESPAPSSSPAPPAPGKRKRTVEEEADAEYARRLASQLNGHNTRAGSAGAASRKKGPSKKKQKKSSEEIQDSDGDDDRGVSARPKKQSKPKKSKKAADDGEEGGTKKRGGYQKEYSLSPALAELTGVQSLSRPQIVKKLWDHIKAHDLQNPEDKREILCDAPMKQIFGVDRLNMFKMNKLIGDHVFDKQE
ncbi:hypothetical protein CTheo_7057 [Ceratobasidium theobromae]|uniref:DM2 domain-containing protein n=1 Tax=Ceratobasidium theobromae TaxID=1582974 RepID=A0A5N5QDI5_9AGAM|nr:hypothetical protein CTheo_7057 [Ceratobasidium theobromae]